MLGAHARRHVSVAASEMRERPFSHGGRASRGRSSKSLKVGLLILREVAVGVYFVQPPHSINIGGVESELVRLAQIPRQKSQNDGEEDAEPEIC